MFTEIGAIGNHTNPSAPTHFYTQEEINEIAQFTSKRFIDVIPKIDMLGHVTAAVKAYLEVNGGGSEKYSNFTFNPSATETLTFLTNALSEIGTIFPYPYIHIGGDEVSFGNH